MSNFHLLTCINVGARDCTTNPYCISSGNLYKYTQFTKEVKIYSTLRPSCKNAAIERLEKELVPIVQLSYVYVPVTAMGIVRH